ncbi:MAG: hypothetical protein NTX24_03395 [Candidatus Pacearchaeota archaeon]|nr:hypothetical protein [Candidatus Pacearchaeota archaeon]
MEYFPEKKEIICDRELSKLDKFVLDFVKLLDNYVIISGYVAILLGRSRATEDVDLLVPKMDFSEFSSIWGRINSGGFECLNENNIKDAFDSLKEHALRFFKKVPMPNVEFKTIKNYLDEYSLKNKLKVIIKDKIIFISPIEIQIAYKLFLGTEKDLEDAKHIYELFKEKINKEELIRFIDLLKVNDKFKEIQ